MKAKEDVIYASDVVGMLIGKVPTKREIKMFAYSHGLTLVLMSALFVVYMLLSIINILVG